MANLNTEVSVYVTAKTEGALSFWTREFEGFFGGTTTMTAHGTWKGESEKVNVVSHLYDRLDPDFKYYELSNLARDYKRVERQDVVLIVEREVKTTLV